MKGNEEQKAKEQKRSCPYCEEEIFTAGLPFCRPCSVTLRYCVRCQVAVAREETVCPQCGGELEWK